MTDRQRLRLRHIRIHGHDVGYRMAGEGPGLVLVHGLTGSSTTWREVMPALTERFTVLAPDLLGHGESAKPRGDYSLGAFASGVRDLMVALGMERATVVGHSLGGGVAARLGFRSSVRGAEVWRSYTGLTEIRGRTAFVHTVRSVIDVTGQRVSARDRLYLAEEIPTLVVWGDRDRIIPVSHAHATHALIPGSRLEIVPGVGHFLPFEAPDAFLEALLGFVDGTEPAAPDEERFRSLMLAHTQQAGEPAPG